MNGQLKLSVAEIKAAATSLRDYATQLEDQISAMMTRIQNLESNQEFKTVAGSQSFYDKAETFNANTPKFIEAINKFANFLDQTVVTNYEETDTQITQAQASLEEQLAALESSGNVGE